MNDRDCGVRPEDVRQFVDEYAGGPEVAERILAILDEEIPCRLEAIRTEYESHNLLNAASVVHSLISSVGVLGNTCQTETIRDLEKALRGAHDRSACEHRSASESDCRSETHSGSEPDSASQAASDVASRFDRFNREMVTLRDAIRCVLSANSNSEA